MKLPGEVTPRRIESITPTRAETLRSCFLRAAFESSPEHRRLVFRGPAARLGSACHAILESAANGRLDAATDGAINEQFEALWREVVAREETAALDNPLEQHFGPARTWPYYELHRARVLSAVRQIVAARIARHQDAPRTAGSAVLAERAYSAFSGRLHGRADKVVLTPDGVEIEDFKTGTIFEESQASESIVRESYRRQLLLYAALHHEETGIWPRIARIVSLNGQQATILVDLDEALLVLQNTMKLLDDYNGLVEQGEPPAAFARPSVDACRFCPFRGMCEPFWSAVSPSWIYNGMVCLRGAAVRVSVFPASGSTLEVDVAYGNLPPGQYRLLALASSRFPDVVQIPAGSSIRAVDFRTADRGVSSDLRPAVGSQIWWGN